MRPTFRFPIAWLLGLVLYAALGLAALRSPTVTWASGVLLLTCAVLALAVVGVVCGGKAGRAWWLGFALFGLGYLALMVWSETYASVRSPTVALLQAIVMYVTHPRLPDPSGFGGSELYEYYFSSIANSLWSLPIAAIGGLLSHLFFAPGPVPPGAILAQAPDAPPASKRWWRRPRVVGFAVLIVCLALALAGARKAPGIAAGVMLLVTWASLGLIGIAAAFGRGRRRAACLGAVLFGAGYLLVLHGHQEPFQPWPEHATNQLLNGLRPWLPSVVSEFPPASDGVAFANARIIQALDKVIPMRFPESITLEAFVKYVATAARGSDGGDIPIYVNPVALQEAEKTLSSTIYLDLDGAPLRRTLPLAFKQLDLGYRVKDGWIMIEYPSGDYEDERALNDPFLTIGQCVLALLAAGLGSLLAPRVYDRVAPKTSPGVDNSPSLRSDR